MDLIKGTTNFLLIAVILVFGFPALGFSQTLPICNEKSGLAWDMNVEPDMDKYTLYHSSDSGIVLGRDPMTGMVTVGANVQSITIPHDPSSAIDNGDGTFMVVHRIALPEGDRFMVLTASDKSQNETDGSNEVGCKIDGTPRTPTIELRFNLP